MTRISTGFVVVFTAVTVAAQSSDREMLARIRAEGLERSQVAAVFEYLTTDIGPRLTASPAHKRAAEWTRDRLASYGLANVHLEPWKFGRGWTLEQLSVELIEPRYLPLIGYADGWSASTNGEIVATPVFIGGKSLDEVQAMGARLKGAIVMSQPMMTNFVRRDRPNPSDESYQPNSAAYATSVGRGNAPAAAASAPASGRPSTSSGRADAETPQQRAQRMVNALRDAGAAVILKPSVGEHGTVFVTGRDGGPGATPSVTLSGEQYNMIARMVEKNIPVKLRVNVQSKFYDADQGNAYNVIAELPGTDPVLRDEVVMIGAHLDSWHTGVGATDNADGSTTVMEAMRILTAIGARPRRTIRMALWGGEEQGLLGSRAWVAQHLAGDANKAARDKFDVYFNIDNGTGAIYGWYLQNNEEVRAIFDGWLDPLKSLGARRNNIESVGSTDHLSFIDAGVPGFNPIQDYVNYDIRTHHTNMDTVERLQEKDIQQAAIVMAAFAYNAANLDRKIPHKGR
jgi:carboxypeptidase Q